MSNIELHMVRAPEKRKFFREVILDKKVDFIGIQKTQLIGKE